MSDVEERIDRMFDLGTNSGDEGTQGDAQQGTTADGQGGASQPQDGSQQVNDTDRQRVDANNRTQQPAQRQPAARQPQQGAPRPTDNGDLVDPETGQVVARAGRERRVYEINRAVEKATTPLRSQLQTVETELRAYKEAATLPQQLGLAPQDVTTAMQFMAHWRRDPVGAAQNILAELRAGGYDINQLGSAVDVNAVKRVVQEAVQPFQQDREQQRLLAEQQAEVQREVDAVFAEHPWTRANQQELSLVLEQDPNMSLRDAVYRLHVWALENGYDINRSLREQHLARANGAQPQTAQPTNGVSPQQPRNNARMPPPNGGANVVPRRPDAPMRHDRSTRDIVREALREHGINVDG
jgi:hypothetical protein